ncbi:ABC transporter ATP-binding protein [Paludisphaera mucosa]|uniref:ABC transporter ATP-binding protein n=1 Tax=Paludisphaera mucosa TaxID=3030827 RepID=A0ABT6FH38_9BACT|nr:ABC transporter ATP-binding protein [Paludisphaera mucosa]MDG3006857.1 ABC transporter ATP-binding protein [Paludisphaera mucosa]
MTAGRPPLPRLRVQGLACGYGRGRPDVLTGVELDVEAGSILALLGPNGSGKTTLLRTLARLLPPRAGSITVDGEDAWKRGRAWSHRRVAIALQDEPQGSRLTIDEVVRLGRAAHRGWWLPMTDEDGAVVERVLERTRLAPIRDRTVDALSAGEWQRVVLAQAMAQEPRVLLLDEPTAHLDWHYQFEILELVDHLARDEGLAVVLSLHDLNQASTWADRIALLAEGALLCVGSPEEVLTADLLARAYRCPVLVDRHPLTGAPMVLPPPRSRRGAEETRKP